MSNLISCEVAVEHKRLLASSRTPQKKIDVCCRVACVIFTPNVGMAMGTHTQNGR